MKFSSYLKEHILGFFLLMITLFCIEIFLLIYQTSLFFQLGIAFSILFMYFLILFIEYWKRKEWYEELLKNLKALNQKYLLPEMIKETNFVEADILKEVLQECGKSMIENVNEYKRLNRDYQDYIELWIHEIKTPIAASKMIIQNNPNEVTNNIDEEVDKIDRYVEQALYYARSNYLEKDYMIKKTELMPMIKEIMMRNRKAILGENIKVELKDLEKTVYTDAKWMNFILGQVMTNAIQYRKQQDPLISIYATKEQNKTTLIIEDNGIGMEEEEIKKAFEKGYTGTNGRRGNKATGIGLYLCQKLCHKMGHCISIQSEKGRGTKVLISFPENSMVTILNNVTKM